jgi:hypothetical protein
MFPAGYARSKNLAYSCGHVEPRSVPLLRAIKRLPNPFD